MSITKKDISKNISAEIGLTRNISELILNNFLNIFKKEIKTKTIKINRFGTFKVSITPKRLGRNPKTKKTYVIDARNRLSFTASSRIRKELN